MVILIKEGVQVLVIKMNLQLRYFHAFIYSVILFSYALYGPTTQICIFTTIEGGNSTQASITMSTRKKA